MKISELVRGMRERLRMSQSQFAATLRCSQNSISRYESGLVEPGLEVLLALHDIGNAEEKHILTSQIKKHLATTGRFFSEGASVENLRGLIQDSAVEDLLLRGVHPAHRAEWQPFMTEVSRLIGTDRGIDESLVELLRLWADHSGDSRARKIFRDAAAYVRVQLSMP